MGFLVDGKNSTRSPKQHRALHRQIKLYYSNPLANPLRASPAAAPEIGRSPRTSASVSWESPGAASVRFDGSETPLVAEEDDQGWPGFDWVSGTAAAWLHRRAAFVPRSPTKMAKTELVPRNHYERTRGKQRDEDAPFLIWNCTFLCAIFGLAPRQCHSYYLVLLWWTCLLRSTWINHFSIATKQFKLLCFHTLCEGRRRIGDISGDIGAI
jgi:hypothetical protein